MSTEIQKQITTGQERWFPIKGYEGLYLISSIGRVKSITRMVRHSRGGMQILRGRILKVSKSGPYNTAGLSKNGKIKTHKIHILVASAFLKRPRGKVIDHINGDKKDNRISNLRYCTQRDNLGNMSIKSKAGYTGVSINDERYTKRFRARIRVGEKMKELGSYKTALEASNAYQIAKQQIQNGKH